MIEVKNVTKKYGSFTAVDDISFEVKDHEVVGFLGANGAGKTTTMNMITGYIEPSNGAILVNGYDVSKSPLKAKKQIGYMPENTPLYMDLTVKEFITYMAELKRINRKEKKQEVEKIIEKTGLKNVENKLIKNISRGYKQRVSLAGALIGNPDVLILDEPTVGLDPKQIADIRELIKSLGKEHTVILSSHILSEVSQICEKVIIINKGKIVEIDTPEHLEEKTKNDNSIIVTVEDKDSNMKNISKYIDGITAIKLVKENDDNTKEYLIYGKPDVDIRKIAFAEFPKHNISIFELKKNENTLEDAFLTIIDEQEIKIKDDEEKAEREKAIRKAEILKMNKKDKKIAIKEDKQKEKMEKNAEIIKEIEEEEQIKETEKRKRQELKEKKKENKIEKKKEKKERKQNKREIKERQRESRKEIKEKQTENKRKIKEEQNGNNEKLKDGKNKKEDKIHNSSNISSESMNDKKGGKE